MSIFEKILGPPLDQPGLKENEDKKVEQSKETREINNLEKKESSVTQLFTKEFLNRHQNDKFEEEKTKDEAMLIRMWLAQDLEEIGSSFGFVISKSYTEEKNERSNLTISARDPHSGKYIKFTVTLKGPEIIAEVGVEDSAKPEFVDKIIDGLKKRGILIIPIIKINDQIFTEKLPDRPPEPAYLERPWWGLLEKGSRIINAKTKETYIFLESGIHQPIIYYFLNEKTRTSLQLAESDFRDFDLVNRPEDLGAFLNKLTDEQKRNELNRINNTLERERHQ